MKSNSIKKVSTIVFIICGFFIVFFLSDFIEKNKPILLEEYADEDLALQGANLKGYAFGFEGLIADWYWMQALQYLGEKIVRNPDTKISLDNLKALNPRLLYPLLDNAVTLDPKFLSVYEYGATVLPAIDKDKAVNLLENGISENPDEWRLYNYLGFIYWREGNYEKASQIYSRGAKLPNAPKFMLFMAAKTKSEGGSRETARTVYQQIFDEAQDDQTKENARLRLLHLDSLDEQDAIRAILKDFQAKTGRCANDWREIFPLIQKARLPNGSDLRVDSKTLAPVDPSEIPYVLDRNDNKCNVHIDFAESKIPAQ